MRVAVAHQAASSSRRIALREAAQEAHVRGTELAVLHVVDSLDLDVDEAYRSGLRDEAESTLRDSVARDVPWRLHLATASEDVSARSCW